MKTLKFADESIIEVTDDSTISSLTVPFSQYAELDAVVAKFTVENLARVELDGVVFISLSVVSTHVDTASKQLVVVTRMPTPEELINTKIAELQDAIIEILDIIGGGE